MNTFGWFHVLAVLQLTALDWVVYLYAKEQRSSLWFDVSDFHSQSCAHFSGVGSVGAAIHTALLAYLHIAPATRTHQELTSFN